MGEFSFIGLDALISKGRLACRLAVIESVAELEGKVVDATPVDSTDLQASTTTHGPRGGGDVVEAKVEQGAGVEDYAIIVHEKHSHRGPAKQVQRPLLSHRDRHRALLSQHARKAF